MARKFLEGILDDDDTVGRNTSTYRPGPLQISAPPTWEIAPQHANASASASAAQPPPVVFYPSATPQQPSPPIHAPSSQNVGAKALWPPSGSSSLSASTPGSAFPVLQEEATQNANAFIYAGTQSLFFQALTAKKKAKRNSLDVPQLFSNALQEVARLFLLPAIATGAQWNVITKNLEGELSYIHSQQCFPIFRELHLAIARASCQHYTASCLSTIFQLVSQIEAVVEESNFPCGKFPQWTDVHRAALTVTSLSGASSVSFQLYETMSYGINPIPLASVEVFPLQLETIDHATPFSKFVALYFMARCQSTNMQLEICVGTCDEAVCRLAPLISFKTALFTQSQGFRVLGLTSLLTFPTTLCFCGLMAQWRHLAAEIVLCRALEMSQFEFVAL